MKNYLHIYSSVFSTWLIAVRYLFLLVFTLLLLVGHVTPQTAGIVVQTGHLDSVNSVAFSPDGKQILSASMDGTCKLWDTKTGQEIRTFTEAGRSRSTSHIQTAFFSHDNARVLTLDGGKIKIWDALIGKQIRTVGDQGEFDIFALSSDGKQIVAAMATGSVKLFDAETGAYIRDLVHPSYFVWERIAVLTFSPDGRTVAGGSQDKTIKLWNTETGRQINVLSGHSHWVNVVAFSPDGKLLASAGADDKIKVWDVTTGTELPTIFPSAIAVRSLIFSLDGRHLISGDGGGLMKLWDVDSGKEIRKVQAHFGQYSRSVNSVAISPDGKQIVTGGDDKTIKLWDLETGNEIRTLSGNTALVTYVGFSPNGNQIVTGSYDNTIKFWNLESGADFRLLDNDDEASVFDFSPDGRFIATSDNGIKIWDAMTGELIKTINPGFVDGISNSVTFTPNGRQLISSDQDLTIKIWDVATEKLIKTLFVQSTMASEIGNAIINVAFSPDGKLFVTVTSSGKIVLWDALTGKQVRPMATRVNISRLMFSPDSKQIAGAVYYERNLKFWNVANGEEIKYDKLPDWININAGGFAVGRFSGRAIQAEATGGRIILCDANSKQELASLISLGKKNWVVTTPEGRFDTNQDLDKIKGLCWVLSDDPMTPKPLELFMRQYYEPGLLRRLLNGEQFKKLPSIAEINRVQPNVGKPTGSATGKQ